MQPLHRRMQDDQAHRTEVAWNPRAEAARRAYNRPPADLVAGGLGTGHRFVLPTVTEIPSPTIEAAAGIDDGMTT
jgi:hypothetical protein